jgi:hypothetical protein
LDQVFILKGVDMNLHKLVFFALLLLSGPLFITSAWSEESSSGFSWQSDDQAISLYEGTQPVLKFNYAFLDHKDLNVPEDELRRFAGDYIYPLYGVLGENLVDDAPKDHYHHHGVFWTWPGVFVHDENGKTKQYDLWTSNTHIRQRFLNLESIEVYDDSAAVSIKNGWFVGEQATVPDELLEPSKRGLTIAENETLYGEKIVDERVTLIIHPIEFVEGFKTRSIDFELELTPTSKDISLQGAEKKSYGGLTIRFRPYGEIGNDRFITTDEGVAKDDMPEKELRWADYTSRFGGVDRKTGKNDALSGAAIFLAPDFPGYPPTWLTRYYGPLCVGFPGVEAQRFEAGRTIVMKARFWIHEGLVSPELLRKAYEDYVSNY